MFTLSAKWSQLKLEPISLLSKLMENLMDSEPLLTMLNLEEPPDMVMNNSLKTEDLRMDIALERGGRCSKETFMVGINALLKSVMERSTTGTGKKELTLLKLTPTTTETSIKSSA